MVGNSSFPDAAFYVTQAAHWLKFAPHVGHEKITYKKKIRLMPWEVRYSSHAMDDYTKITEWFMSIDDNFGTEKRDDMYIYSPGSVDLGIY